MAIEISDPITSSVNKAEANRSNAQKSTGPKTSEGKRKSSRNAVKHGVLASPHLLEYDDREEFEALLAEYTQELQPRGILERR